MPPIFQLPWSNPAGSCAGFSTMRRWQDEWIERPILWLVRNELRQEKGPAPGSRPLLGATHRFSGSLVHLCFRHGSDAIQRFAQFRIGHRINLTERNCAPRDVAFGVDNE